MHFLIWIWWLSGLYQLTGSLSTSSRIQTNVLLETALRLLSETLLRSYAAENLQSAPVTCKEITN